MKKYTNAREVLPDSLVKEIQKYVQGQHLYIPQTTRKAWGTDTGSKEELKKRNEEIVKAYRSGRDISSIAQMFNLSEERIRGIIYSSQIE